MKTYIDNNKKLLKLALLFLIIITLIFITKNAYAAETVERVDSTTSNKIKSITGGKEYAVSSSPSLSTIDDTLKYYVKKIYNIGNDDLINQDLPDDIKPGRRIGPVGGTKGTFNYNATVQSDYADVWRRLLVQNDLF